MLVGYNWPLAAAIGVLMSVVATAVIYIYLSAFKVR